MILFGHKFIQSENFFHVLNIDAIKHTPPSSNIYIEFNASTIELILHAQENNLSFGVNVANITELIYSSNLGASYIMVTSDLAKDAQNIANEYLFDAKILVHIEYDSQIEALALLGVDGVIYSNAIIKTLS